jgi:predicted Zn-dependent protease
MKKIAASVLALAVLHGCAGAQFALPQLSDAEISQAALAVPGGTSTLASYQRSNEEYRDIVLKVGNRLKTAAPPLCARAEVSRCTWSIRFVDEDVVNAYASGVDEIVVYRGLLEHLKTEDEIAAVIGHEIGHHLAEHIEEKQDNALIGAILAGIVTGGLMAITGYQSPSYDPSAGQRLVNDSMQVGAVVGAISYSKEQEREADLLGAYLIARAGYDLQIAGNVYKVMAQMNSGHTHSGWFDSHPAGPERIAAWEKTIAEVEASPDKLPREE